MVPRRGLHVVVHDGGSGVRGGKGGLAPHRRRVTDDLLEGVVRGSGGREGGRQDGRMVLQGCDAMSRHGGCSVVVMMVIGHHVVGQGGVYHRSRPR